MITRSIYLTVSVAAMLTCAALAGDDAAEVKTAGYHLKNQSSFQVAPGVRAPFWPIGWAPSARNTTQVDPAAPAVTISPDQFSVTSILLGSQSLAVINGRTYGEGEFLKATRVSKPVEGALPTNAAAAPALPAGVKIRVTRIIDGQVILQAGTQAISVPLRRPALSEKKLGDEDLLSLSDR
jgi:hypothetical protein